SPVELQPSAQLATRPAAAAAGGVGVYVKCAAARRRLDRRAVGEGQEGMKRGDNWFEEEAERAAERRALVIGAHEAQGPFISGLRSWDCIMTGTYSPRKRPGAIETILGVEVAPRVSRWKALRDAKRLCEFASELVGWPVAAVISVEPHMDCSYHLHGVLDLQGARCAFRNALKWWWTERYGWCHFEAPRSRDRVSSYVGKHLTGPVADVFFSEGLV
ncbi:MAG: hypothetical protein MUP64_09110, partial [Anaerolineae bacterium]|nr:hypothetical protein [Anaerolineae bacterium]